MVNCSEFSPWCSCWQTVTNSVSRSADVCPSRCVWMKYISEVSSAEDRNTQILMWSASVYSHCAVCSWTCRVLKEQSSGCERNKTKFHTFLRRGIFNEFYRADRVEKSEAFFWTVMQLSNNEWNRHEHREASWECVTCWRPYNASNTHTHREKAFSPDSQQGSGSGNAMNICVNLLRDTDTHKNKGSLDLKESEKHSGNPTCSEVKGHGHGLSDVIKCVLLHACCIWMKSLWFIVIFNAFLETELCTTQLSLTISYRNELNVPVISHHTSRCLCQHSYEQASVSDLVRHSFKL